ncbi:MAG: hemerythrin domain-containing protein, partial [Flavobacteriaceae bacterium]|nr:hemerythrin domain-containing protein [Flavobacteriaceae bacterium]
IIIQYVQKVAKVHGHYYPRLHQIKNLFIEVSQELEEHLTKEETVLFPFIEEMLNEKTSGSLQSDLSTEDIKECIAMLEEEHERAGNIFKDISILSNNYTPPVDACNTFKALYDLLEEFENDLHIHIHLENNILHPKALAIAQKKNLI